MPVDRELVEQLVVQILGQLELTQATENVLVLGSKYDADNLLLPKDDGVVVKVYSSDDVYNARQIDRYVLPHLELGDMADLAMGKTSSPKAKEVLDLLLIGKTVEVYQYEYTAYENTAAPPLYQLYCDYAETLRGFGLHPLQKQVQKTVRLDGRVISEKDVEKCNIEGITRIGISGNALVTSLAEECAKKFGIEIQRDTRGA